MKRLLGIGSLVLLLGVSFSLHAECIGSQVMGKCYGTETNDNYGNSGGYQGYSGSNYQYDLNYPVDRNSYSIDLDAQRRDSMSTSPGRMNDYGMGQYGGGIYGN